MGAHGHGNEKKGKAKEGASKNATLLFFLVVFILFTAFSARLQIHDGTACVARVGVGVACGGCGLLYPDIEREFGKPSWSYK